MKVPSRYNAIYKLTEGKFMIINTLFNSKAYLTVDMPHVEDVYEKLNGIDSSSLAYEELVKNHFLVESTFNEKDLNDYLCSKALFDHSKLNIRIYLGSKCNFACAYCFQQKETEQYDLADDIIDNLIKTIERNARVLKSLTIEWMGGEPLLYASKIDIYSKKIEKIARYHNFSYVSAIITNGYLLDLTMFKRMLRNRIVTYMVTIDGTNDIHEKQRPHKSGYQTYNVIVSQLREIAKTKPRYVQLVLRINVTPWILENQKEVMCSLKDIVSGTDIVVKPIPAIDIEVESAFVNQDEFLQFVLFFKMSGIRILLPIGTEFMSNVCSSGDE